jgi:hypothetical protein
MPCKDTKRIATVVAKDLQPSGYTVFVQGIGKRSIVVESTLAGKEVGTRFLVDWFPKGQCWIASEVV